MLRAKANSGGQRRQRAGDEMDQLPLAVGAGLREQAFEVVPDRFPADRQRRRDAVEIHAGDEEACRASLLGGQAEDGFKGLRLDLVLLGMAGEYHQDCRRGDAEVEKRRTRGRQSLKLEQPAA